MPRAPDVPVSYRAARIALAVALVCGLAAVAVVGWRVPVRVVSGEIDLQATVWRFFHVVR